MHNQEWHEWRRKGVGSSDAVILMGASPKGWGTPFQLWEEKYLGKVNDKDNYAMRRGRETEETARCEFEKLMGVMVAPKPVIHADMEWIRANLDGIDMDGKVVVEIKCPNKDDHYSAICKKVPDKYYPQVQHQLLVTGLDGMYYFSFDGKDGAIVEVARDQAYIDSMLKEEAAFWDHVLKGTPPDLTEEDYICREEETEWNKWSNLLRVVSKEKKSAKEGLNAIEERYVEYLEELKRLSQGRSSKGNGLMLERKPVDAVEIKAYTKKAYVKWVPRFIG